jgi:hypothetical protein
VSTEVTVASIPPCDLCKDYLGKLGISTPAAYDGKTTFGWWAYMCEEHWTLYGVGRLGTGYGQRLVLAE